MENGDQKLALALIDTNYCDFLRQFDKRVAYNKNNKTNRPFVGVLFEVNNFKYFAPLSSPKPKHLKMPNKTDFMRIDGGRLGAVNFNNMIPLIDGVYKLLELDKTDLSVSEAEYQDLLIDQRNWLNTNRVQLKKRAERLYKNYLINKIPKAMKLRCCNFPLLEQKCLEYKIKED